MRIAVTGAAGMLGQAVTAAAERRGHDVVGFDIAGGGHECSTSPTSAPTREALGEVGPQAVINCAAYTNVDGAESDEERALAAQRRRRRASSRRAAAAARRARSCTSRPTTSSTATKTEPYVESDPTAPQSAYGRTKLAGEHARRRGQRRTTRSSAPRGSTARAARTSSRRCCASPASATRCSVVTDQVGCPTWTGHLADALLEIAERPDTGLFHCAGAGTCSWYDFTVEIFDRAGVTCRVRPTTQRGLPAPGARGPRTA